jgi:hypothetical protein
MNSKMRVAWALAHVFFGHRDCVAQSSQIVFHYLIYLKYHFFNSILLKYYKNQIKSLFSYSIYYFELIIIRKHRY